MGEGRGDGGSGEVEKGTWKGTARLMGELRSRLVQMGRKQGNKAV